MLFPSFSFYIITYIPFYVCVFQTNFYNMPSSEKFSVLFTEGFVVGWVVVMVSVIVFMFVKWLLVKKATTKKNEKIMKEIKEFTNERTKNRMVRACLFLFSSFCYGKQDFKILFLEDKTMTIFAEKVYGYKEFPKHFHNKLVLSCDKS
jgi:uncharacterized membrane protein YciS (DUF1049 family)